MAKEIEELKMVQVGRNLNVTLGSEKFTIQGSKEELAPVKAAVETFKDKPTKDNRKKILDLLKPRTTEVEGMKERIKADTKKVKNEAKAEPANKEAKKKKAAVSDVVKDIEDKEYTQEELDKMQKAIDKAKEKKASTSQSEPTTSRRPSGREW